MKRNLQVVELPPRNVKIVSLDFTKSEHSIYRKLHLRVAKMSDHVLSSHNKAMQVSEIDGRLLLLLFFASHFLNPRLLSSLGVRVASEAQEII